MQAGTFERLLEPEVRHRPSRTQLLLEEDT